MTKNIFERASRKKTRFQSTRGELTVENLWDTPLTSSDGFCLDKIALQINGELKELEEGSFVKTKPDPRVGLLTLQLDIVKHIIAVKLEDAEKAKTAAERRQRRAKIIDALGEKEDADLAKKSRKSLLAELQGLDEEEPTEE